MALKIIDYGSPEYQQMVKLRDAVLRKPLGLTFTQDDLESEKDNILIAAFEEERMLGCCMLVEERPDIVRLKTNGGIKCVAGQRRRSRPDKFCRKHCPGPGLQDRKNARPQ
jgi:hypothetical protein